MQISFSIRRDKHLVGRLGALRGPTAFLQMQQLTLQGAQVVAQRMSALAPKDTGRLARSIRAEVLPRGKNPASAAVSKDRGGGKPVGKKKKRVWYAWPVETGHYAGRAASKKRTARTPKQQLALARSEVRKSARTKRVRAMLAAGKSPGLSTLKALAPTGVAETRTWVPPQPFRKPAVQQSRQQVLAIIRNGLNQIIAASK